MQDEYKLTQRRTTNELESDDTALPPTKAVLLYGWDTGTLAKYKLACNASGLLQIDPTDIDTRYWTTATNQTLLTGNKSGSFDLTTTGAIDGNYIRLHDAYLSGGIDKWAFWGENVYYTLAAGYVIPNLAFKSNLLSMDVTNGLLYRQSQTAGDYDWVTRMACSMTGNWTFTLGDALGATKLSIQDNSPTEVASINSDGLIIGTNITDSGLTSGRIPYASTGGLLVDNSALTFATTTGLYVNANLGVGVAPYTYNAVGTEAVINAIRTFTDKTAGASKLGYYSDIRWAPTGTTSQVQYIAGMVFNTSIDVGVTSNATGSGSYLTSLKTTCLHRGNGLVDNLYGNLIQFGTYNSGSDSTGTITNCFGAYVGGLKTTSSTITYAYGVYITGVQGSTAYDIYASDTGVLNYLAGKTGIGVGTPTAVLHLKAGTATANTASLKIDAGTLLGTTEAGTLENDGTHLHFTFANSGTRYQLDQQSATITGTDTRVLFFDGANSPAGDAGFVYNKTTNTVTVDEVVHNGVASDPAAPADGSIWYRSDVDEFRGRAAGITYKFVMEIA